MTDTYIVTFPAGAYGNFIGWTLKWISDDSIDVNDRPWNDVMNNSHNWKKTHHHWLPDACANVVSGSIVHYIDAENIDFRYNIDLLLQHYSKVILLHPTMDTLLWSCNNKFERVWREGWFNQPDKEHMADALSRWDGAKELWQKREFLSFYLHKQHISENCIVELSNYNHQRLLKISIDMIKDNFNTTIEKLVGFIGIVNIRTKHDLDLLYRDWLQRQPHIDKDRLINQLIDAIVNDIDAPMEDLTLVDTAAIQRALREDHKLEIKCYGLNTWPKTTKKLQTLLYRISK